MQLQISHISANTMVLREGRVEDRAVVPGVGERPRETRAEEDALEDVLEAVSYTHLTLPTKRIV